MGSRGGEQVADLVLRAEVCHMLAREIGSIIGDDGIRKLETTNDVLLKEFHYLLSRDFRERHRLYPLSEVISGYQEETELDRAHGEAHYIEPLLHEEPGAPQSVKVFAQPVGGGSQPLILCTLPYVFLGVVEHLRLVVPMVNGFVGEISSPDMIFKVAIMHLLHYPLGLLGSGASQVWVRV